MAGLRDAIAGLLRRPARPETARAEPTIRASSNTITTSEELEKAWGHMLLGGALTDSGVTVSTETAQRFASVGSCVRVLSDDVAHLPLILFKMDGQSRLPDRKHPLYSLLKDRPNEWMTSFDWRKIKQRDLLFRGVAYSLVVRDLRDRPIELIRLHPDRVTPKQDDRTMVVTYEYTRPDGRRVTLQQKDVFVVRYATDDGVTPLSPIALFRETIGDGVALRKHGSMFFGNGAKPLGLLETEGSFRTPEDRRALREDFESLYAGPNNAHRVAILDNGLKYKPVSISMEDAQYLEARKFNRSEVAGIFGVPLHKIGDLERATFSNIEHQSIAYVTDSLTPWLVNWEQAIKRDLLNGDSDRFVKFNVNALLRGDTKSRAEARQIERRNGIISANEWRESEDLNPREDEGGGKYIIEQNMRYDDGTNPDAATPVDPGGDQP